MPSVLLTLLSIVQALALELLWSYVREADYMFSLSAESVLTWMQVAANFLGIIVIWIVYAGTVMRFRWLPTTSDSVYPFVVGGLEFVLIETLAPPYLGLWCLCYALVYALMTWVTHHQMRRARRDGGNDEFFAHVEPATLKDFLPAIVIVSIGALSGTYLHLSGARDAMAFVIVSAFLVVLLRQLALTARFWELSFRDRE